MFGPCTEQPPMSSLLSLSLFRSALPSLEIPGGLIEAQDAGPTSDFSFGRWEWNLSIYPSDKFLRDAGTASLGTTH